LQFNLHPRRYGVRICPGPLRRDGEELEAITHSSEILLSGEVAPIERSEVLFDQLLFLREKHQGEPSRRALASFMVDAMRQLLSQGGEPALMRLSANGTVDAGGTEALSAEPVGCECGQCGTRYAPHQIATAGAEFDAGAGRLVVRRSVECDFCGHVMSWTEGATAAGKPNGRVMAGPFYSKPHVTAPSE
jgi:hypothetical protein